MLVAPSGDTAGLAHEVTILEVEAVELVASRLGIHYVFIDHKGRAFGVVGNALTNLAATR